MLKKKQFSILEKSGFQTHVSGNQILILGDTFEILPLIKMKLDACITDPPYNISGYDNKGKIGWYQSNDYWRNEKKFAKIDEEWDKFTNEDYLRFTKDWLSLVSKKIKPNGNLLIFGTSILLSQR